MYSKDAQRRWGNETTNLFCDIKYKDQSYSNIIEEMQKKIKLAYTHISNIEITYDINNFEDKINYLSNCKSEKENNCTASSSSFTLLQETTETPLNKSVISNYNNDNYKIDCIFVIPHNKS